MSIILKGMCNFGSNTSGGEGTVDPPVVTPDPEDIAPNVVSNVSFTDNGKGSITVKWTDPNDTVLDGVTIAKWYRTVLVYKKGSAPTSITDGQTVNNYTKNQYLYNGYPLTIDPDVTYYFKFFTVSDKNKVNTSDRSYTFESVGIIVDPILENNSWSTIIEVANKGKAQDYWKIGDTKTVLIRGGYGSNQYDETVTMQIWDFNHFDKSDGSGKANILFGGKDCLEDTTYFNKQAYSKCNIKQDINNYVYPYIQDQDLKNGIKSVVINSSAARETSASHTDSSTETIFIPGSTEVGLYQGLDGNQSKIPIFTDVKSRIKKARESYILQNVDWWTRSVVGGYIQNTVLYPEVITVNSGGIITETIAFGSGASSYTNCGVCICFNV